MDIQQLRDMIADLPGDTPVFGVDEDGVLFSVEGRYEEVDGDERFVNVPSAFFIGIFEEVDSIERVYRGESGGA